MAIHLRAAASSLARLLGAYLEVHTVPSGHCDEIEQRLCTAACLLRPCPWKMRLEMLN